MLCEGSCPHNGATKITFDLGVGVVHFFRDTLTEARHLQIVRALHRDALLEPPRVVRGLHALRGWSHDTAATAGKIPGRDAGAGGADGVRVRTSLRLAVGSDLFGR